MDFLLEKLEGYRKRLQLINVKDKEAIEEDKEAEEEDIVDSNIKEHFKTSIN